MFVRKKNQKTVSNEDNMKDIIKKLDIIIAAESSKAMDETDTDLIEECINYSWELTEMDAKKSKNKEKKFGFFGTKKIAYVIAAVAGLLSVMVLTVIGITINKGSEQEPPKSEVGVERFDWSLSDDEMKQKVEHIIMDFNYTHFVTASSIPNVRFLEPFFPMSNKLIELGPEAIPYILNFVYEHVPSLGSNNPALIIVYDTVLYELGWAKLIPAKDRSLLTVGDNGKYKTNDNLVVYYDAFCTISPIKGAPWEEYVLSEEYSDLLKLQRKVCQIKEYLKEQGEKFVLPDVQKLEWAKVHGVFDWNIFDSLTKDEVHDLLDGIDVEFIGDTFEITDSSKEVKERIMSLGIEAIPYILSYVSSSNIVTVKASEVEKYRFFADEINVDNFKDSYTSTGYKKVYSVDITSGLAEQKKKVFIMDCVAEMLGCKGDWDYIKTAEWEKKMSDQMKSPKKYTNVTMDLFYRAEVRKYLHENGAKYARAE